MVGVHKDFHGLLSGCLQYLADYYGEGEVEAYLRQVAAQVYRPLSQALARQGLAALEAHWQRIFELEEADVDLRYEGEQLVLQVHTCPALEYMRDNSEHIYPKFCEHTRIVNQGICQPAGYECAVEYDQDAGCCVQRFWRGDE